MASETSKTPLRVVIIGGAITGLTLAHCLDKAGIDYVVLEKQQDILANVGGPLALQPNGCRVLDQVGVFDHLKKFRNDLDSTTAILPDGFMYHSSVYASFSKGLGYPVTVVTRKNLLVALFTSLQRRANVKLGTKVVDISPSSTPNGPLTVTTENGEQYIADVVVGADGVNGITRAHMWRMAALQDPTRWTMMQSDNHSLTVDYSCILGITSPAHELTQIMKPGRMYTRSYRYMFWMVVPNFDGTINWFVTIKMDKTYVHPHVPKWSQAEVQTKLQELADYEMYGSVKFRDLWQITPSIFSTPCHEGLLTTWSFGRVICAGDTAFKLTPNIAQGANLCIESAAALANTLNRLNTARTKPTDSDIRFALTQTAGSIQPRIRRICSNSYRMSRVQTLETRVGWFVSRYVLRYLAQSMLLFALRIMWSAATLDYVPLPERDRRASERRVRKWQRWSTIMQISCCVLGLAGVSFFTFLR